MSLVLDQGVPRDAATHLRGLGYGCMRLGEIGMSKAADEEILAFSLEKNAIMATLAIHHPRAVINTLNLLDLR
jgi:predicted nuclease of predicted toxin-antitoxin system